MDRRGGKDELAGPLEEDNNRSSGGPRDHRYRHSQQHRPYDTRGGKGGYYEDYSRGGGYKDYEYSERHSSDRHFDDKDTRDQPRDSRGGRDNREYMKVIFFSFSDL